jgi:hypothetical protein
VSQVERALGGGQLMLPGGDRTVPGEPALVRGGPAAHEAARGLLHGGLPDGDERGSHGGPGGPASGPSADEVGVGRPGDGFPDRGQALLGFDVWQGIPKGQRLLVDPAVPLPGGRDGEAAGSGAPMDQARVEAMATLVLSGVVS